jgi:hypothetical protein
MEVLKVATLEEIKQVKNKVQSDLMKKKNVTGVGIGFKETNGKKTEELCLIVMVTQKVESSELSSKDLIPAEIQGIMTDVKAVGRIVIHKSRKDRWRPAPPGVSIGHEYVTAGTFGSVVWDNATNKKLILSNNHVLANSNDARKKDAIVQPGPIDGGKAPQDLVAELERFVPIIFEKSDTNICSVANGVAGIANFIAGILGSKSRLAALRIESTSNEVDAAVAVPWKDSVTEEILDIGAVMGVTEPGLDMKVKKSGRTTGVTEGTITGLNAAVEVEYGNGKIALFENQIVTTDMSEPGDSGSLLLEAETNKAVGLLFAGSDEITVFCPINRVMELLDVNFG